MKQKVSVGDLRVGMYVELPLSWTEHNFLRSKFKLTSPEQIAAVRAHGLREVMVDFARSDVPPPSPPQPLGELEYVSHSDAIVDPKDAPPPPLWNPDTLVPAELREAVHDQRLAPEQKAQAVYRHSREMMLRMLDAPSAENIRASKEALGSVTDLILRDDQTARNLLRITAHDFYTYTHSVNVGIISLMLAKALFKNSDGHDMQELGAGFFLHDLGKVMVDPAIINKPARLDETEMRRMRIHPYQGYKLLRDADALTEECRIIVMEHHELMDGGGYPKRVKGDQIHIYGRICCIADVFDALTAERSYKKAMTPFDALTLMRDKMPNHFDRPLFNRFVELFR
jgi:HD-GYP domain-containing protein (c-di-GMP phosphodiesterase class II)